jgi:hypothetical protein
MFTTLTVAMTLSGAVAVETPARFTEATRPPLVQLASKFSGGNKLNSYGHGKGGKSAKPVHYSIGKHGGGKPTGYGYGGTGYGKPTGYGYSGAGYGKPTGGQNYGNGPVTFAPKEPGPVNAPPAGNSAPPPNNNGVSIEQVRELTQKKG